MHDKNKDCLVLGINFSTFVFCYDCMKIYWRILRLTGGLSGFWLPFVVFSLLASLFGVLNLVLLKPLLDVLFGDVSTDMLHELVQKQPSTWDLSGHFQRTFAQFVLDQGKLGGLKFVCLAVILSAFLSNSFRYGSVWTLEKFKIRLIGRLRELLFDRVVHLHIGYFSNERKGHIISRVTTDVQEVENSISSTVSAAIKELFLLVGYVVALIWISPRLTLIALLVIPIIGGFLGVVLKRLRQDAGEGQFRLSALLSVMDEVFGAMRVVKGFVAEPYVQVRFQDENKAYQGAMKRYSRRNLLANPFSEAVGITMVAGILYLGGTLILKSESDLSASLFIAFIAIFSQVVRPAKEITQAISSAQRGVAAAHRVVDLLETKPEVQDAPKAIELTDFQNCISFQEVSFGYQPNLPVLQDINFDIQKGQMVALVGGSGGGKSTLADLLARFYDPSHGVIRMDGLDIKSISQASLRKNMGLVTQESLLFNDTIRANIAFGQDVSQESIERAAKIAQAHEFILQQPHGYDTVIGDRGGRLSGGQRQRLAIARAILLNPPILILDEATSALDTESEKGVQEALQEVMKERTSLVIAHRLSTIQQADMILVLDQGRIVQRGTHASLIEDSEGLYARLVSLQMLER